MPLKVNSWKILSESLVIILSVLFALFINEWRNNYNENKRTQVILENIRQEMLENQALTKNLYAYHSLVKSNILNTLDGDSLETVFFPGPTFELSSVAPRGIIQKDYKDIAWEVAKAEKISSRISFEDSSKLFEVYAQQQTVRETITRIIMLISDRQIHRKALLRESIILLNSELNELVGQEEYFLAKFEKALESLQIKNAE